MSKKAKAKPTAKSKKALTPSAQLELADLSDVSPAPKKKLSAPVKNPILAAVGLAKEKGLYVPYVIKFQDDRVLSVEKGEADAKNVAIEAMKILNVRHFFDIE